MKSLLLLAFIFSSCTVVNYPLKGSYPSTPMVFASTNTFEKTWDKLIDVFAQNGLSIRLIDKSSGLIISTNSRMPASPEDDKGRLKDPTAFIAVPSWRFGGGKKQAISGQASTGYNKTARETYRDVYGEWNVRVKPTSDGSTINVNITNLTYYDYDSKSKTTEFHTLTGYRSTGVFEKMIADMISK